METLSPNWYLIFVKLIFVMSAVFCAGLIILLAFDKFHEYTDE